MNRTNAGVLGCCWLSSWVGVDDSKSMNSDEELEQIRRMLDRVAVQRMINWTPSVQRLWERLAKREVVLLEARTLVTSRP